MPDTNHRAAVKLKSQMTPEQVEKFKDGARQVCVTDPALGGEVVLYVQGSDWTVMVDRIEQTHVEKPKPLEPVGYPQLVTSEAKPKPLHLEFLGTDRRRRLK